MSKSPSAHAAALQHFTDHAAALAEAEQIKRTAAAIEQKLTDSASAAKPDFAKVSALHCERQHLADRLRRVSATIATLEASFTKAGNALYRDAARARAIAGDAAVECVHARLHDDFTGETLAGVARYHPLLIAEEGRNATVRSPQDLPTFSTFAATVPEIVAQIEMAEARAVIYRKATATRALPASAALDDATPEAVRRPFVLKLRPEPSAAEEAERLRALTSAENHKLRELYHQGRAIAGDFNEHADALGTFLARHPEVARFFPVRRTA